MIACRDEERRTATARCRNQKQRLTCASQGGLCLPTHVIARNNVTKQSRSQESMSEIAAAAEFILSPSTPLRINSLEGLPPKELTRAMLKKSATKGGFESPHATIPETVSLRGGPDSCAIRVAEQQAEPIRWTLLVMLAACCSSPVADAVSFRPPAPDGAPIAQLSGPPGGRRLLVSYPEVVLCAMNGPKAR
jgi:hypothetical protein